VITYKSYNMWDSPEVVEETFGSNTRTKKETFDEADRGVTSEVTGTAGTPVSKVTNHYSTSTGALETQSTSTGEMITSVYNKLGELTEYTDAKGVTSDYEYDVDGRVIEVKYGQVDGEKASQTYEYSSPSGFLTKLVDSTSTGSGAGTFTAGYNVEGKIVSERYPDGLTATTTYNPVGQAVALEYVKSAPCGATCDWFSDAVVPSIHGEILEQTSTLSKETYTYDELGRLKKTEEEAPAGGDCTTREYTYDADSNRQSQTTYKPGPKGECTSEEGEEVEHEYDEGGRLADYGVEYDAFNNATALPPADAGGNQLTSTYYVDNQVATQAQGAKTMSYTYDPTGRTLETETKEGESAARTTLDYSGPGSAVTWTSESATAWTRNIPGIGGTLAAIETDGGTPVLQLRDLEGDIIAAAALSEGETKLLKSYNSTEFGVPAEGTAPPKYSWLGAEGVASSGLSSGVIDQEGAAYVPQLGRLVQAEGTVLPAPAAGTAPVANTPLPTWVAEAAAAASARDIAAGQAAVQAREEADKTFATVEEYDPRCSMVAIITGNGKGVVSVLGWASCGEELLPEYSEIEACLFIEPENGELYDIGAKKGCSEEGSGYVPHEPSKTVGLKGSLFAGVSAPCESETAYWGWVWFWIQGGHRGRERFTSPWRCGESKIEVVGEWSETLSGIIPPVAGPW
jgi:YD repeat-containing protein